MSIRMEAGAVLALVVVGGGCAQLSQGVVVRNRLPEAEEAARQRDVARLREICADESLGDATRFAPSVSVAIEAITR
jgi:hypothetical protein